MAHNVESMSYIKGQTPWHGLGNPVSNNLTIEEFQKAAGVDWEVYVDDMYLRMPDGSYQESARKVLRRDSDHKELTWMSGEWHPVQNKEGFEFFREWCELGGMELNTAGSLQGGQIVWVLAKTQEKFALFGRDVTDNYMLFTIPHQYGQATSVRSTMVRVVCNNTLSMALGAKSDMKVSVSHRTKFDAEQVKQALLSNAQKMSKYKDAAKFISKKMYTPETLNEFMATVFPKITTKEAANENNLLSRNAMLAISVMDTQPGAKYGAGTWWQALNAVTFTVDHLIGRSRDSALTSAWYGTNRHKKLVALNQAVEMAKVA